MNKLLNSKLEINGSAGQEGGGSTASRFRLSWKGEEVEVKTHRFRASAEGLDVYLSDLKAAITDYLSVKAVYSTPEGAATYVAEEAHQAA